MEITQEIRNLALLHTHTRERCGIFQLHYFTFPRQIPVATRTGVHRCDDLNLPHDRRRRPVLGRVEFLQQQPANADAETELEWELVTDT